MLSTSAVVLWCAAMSYWSSVFTLPLGPVDVDNNHNKVLRVEATSENCGVRADQLQGRICLSIDDFAKG